MELHLGKMTNKELASWFNNSSDYFNRTKKKKLEELKTFADFDEIYGGVYIKTIYTPVYNKKESKIREVYKKGFEELRSPIDTVSNINNKIFEKYGKELTTLSSPQSGYHYAIEVRNANYGVPFKDVGKLGRCYYLWCKVEKRSDNELYFVQLSPEEEQKKKNLLKQFFGTDEEKDILIAQMVDSGEITEAEAYRLTREYRGLNNAGFMGFLKKLEKEIGAKIVRATKFEKELYFDKTDAEAAIQETLDAPYLV